MQGLSEITQAVATGAGNSELEKQADNKHDIYGNKSLYEVSGEVAAIYESQKALRLRLDSIEEKLDRLLETREERL